MDEKELILLICNMNDFFFFSFVSIGELFCFILFVNKYQFYNWPCKEEILFVLA